MPGLRLLAYSMTLTATQDLSRKAMTQGLTNIRGASRDANTDTDTGADVDPCGHAHIYTNAIGYKHVSADGYPDYSFHRYPDLKSHGYCHLKSYRYSHLKPHSYRNFNSDCRTHRNFYPNPESK